MEKQGQLLDEEDRLALRQRASVPVLQQFHQWLQELQPKVLPKSPIGDAIGYSLNHWVALCRYTEQGYLRIDNNLVENDIRPIAIGGGIGFLQAQIEAVKRLPCCSASLLPPSETTSMCLIT